MKSVRRCLTLGHSPHELDMLVKICQKYVPNFYFPSFLMVSIKNLLVIECCYSIDEGIASLGFHTIEYFLG